MGLKFTRHKAANQDRQVAEDRDFAFIRIFNPLLPGLAGDFSVVGPSMEGQACEVDL